MKNTLDALVPDSSPVQLLLHDWGCYVGALFCNTYPERVSRLVMLDVGLKRSVTLYEGLVILSYQWILAAAFIVYKLLGETAGFSMTYHLLTKLYHELLTVTMYLSLSSPRVSSISGRVPFPSSCTSAETCSGQTAEASERDKSGLWIYLLQLLV